MLEKIINSLKKADVKVWKVKKTETHRAELYFIKKTLDLPRYAEMTEYEVSVYRDFEEGDKKYRGVTLCYVEEGQSDDEIDEKIKNAYFAAQFVKNPFYELADPISAPKKASNSDMAGKDIHEIANAFADEILALPDGDAFVNSLEIFVFRKTVEIVASNGLHVSYDDDYVNGEFVTQCTKPADVEQFRLFAYNNFDTKALKDTVLTAIEDARMRANAEKSPKKGRYNILITGENLKEFFNYYTTRGNASVIFPGYSRWKIGDDIQKFGTGEKLNIDLIATAPYSDDGVEMKNIGFVKNGKLENIYGPTRFMRYLGETPTGNYEKINVSNGTVKFADMKTEGTLETVSFSDFQMDFFTGNFGGEMRLSLLHENGKAIPLTGGSINGKLADIEDKLIFSVERYEDSEYSGPYALLIPDIPVAGE